MWKTPHEHMICSIGYSGQDFQKHCWKSDFPHAELTTPFCPSSPPKSSLSVLSVLLWSRSRGCCRRRQNKHIHSNPELACCTRDACSSAASSAACPGQSLPAIPPASHPAWLWLCHRGPEVPVECVWKACGCVSFDSVTNPSCAAGCGLAEGGEALLVSGCWGGLQ